MGRFLQIFRLIRRSLLPALCAALWVPPQAGADTIYWSEYTSGFGAIYAMDVATRNVSTLIAGTGYGAGGNHIDYPIALAMGPDGNLYVGNANNGDIVKVTPAGVASDYFAVADPTHYPHTYGLAFGSSGNLYLTNMPQNQVMTLSPDGTETLLASGINKPQGGIVDPSGNFNVVTNITLSGEDVVNITPTGVISTFATGVTGVYWDKAGNLYTGVSGRVTITTPNAVLSTLVSGLNFPVPLGLGSSGELYLYDGGANDELLAVSPSGAVTTIAPLPNALDIVVSTPEPSGYLMVPLVGLLLRRSRRNRGCQGGCA